MKRSDVDPTIIKRERQRLALSLSPLSKNIRAPIMTSNRNILRVSSSRANLSQDMIETSSFNGYHPHPTRYYCIFSGNGYNLIKGVMNQREGWKEIPKEEVWQPHNLSKINFIWKPTNFNFKMYTEIDNKLFESAKYFQKSKSFDQELAVNHMENHREITTKTGILRTLKHYYKDNVNFVENGYTVFDSTPTSFVVNSKFETDQWGHFSKRFTDLHTKSLHPIKEKMPTKHCEQNLWLIKPANENQGKGIRIMNDLDEIRRFFESESSVKFSYWVIQKYLEKPLLYKNRKFDIRVWAVVTSNSDFFFYNTGYIRTSSFEYSVHIDKNDDENSKFTHLTNNLL